MIERVAPILVTLLFCTSVLGAESKKSLELQSRVHRLQSEGRSPFDAFAYVNRMPKQGESESIEDYVARIQSRIANQEGRVLIKLPPGFDQRSYEGFKSFHDLGEVRSVGCVSCHSLDHSGEKKSAGRLRNLKINKADFSAIMNRKHQGIEGYSRVRAKEDEDGFHHAFVGSLADVPEEAFRKLILEAEVVDVTQPIPSTDAKTRLSGQVTFVGMSPKRKALKMTPESAALYENVPMDESVLIGKGGGLANVFVYVKKGLKDRDWPMPEESVLINQDRSMFRPRVQGIRVGQTLVMRNSDPFIHNVRSLSLRNRAFNIGQPAKTPDRTKTFRRPEGPVRIECDFHKWMKAYLFVLDHPFYAVTDADGNYEIPNLPAGTYSLEAWHEEFGKQRMEIRIKPTSSNRANFIMSSPEG